MSAPAKPTRGFRWFFFLGLVALEALVCLVWLVSLPGEVSGGLFGMSRARLLLAAPLALALFVGTLLVLASAISSERAAALDRFLERGTKLWSVALGLFLTLLIATILFAARVSLTPSYILANGDPLGISKEMFERVAPLLVFGGLVSFEWTVFASQRLAPQSGGTSWRAELRNLPSLLLLLLPGLAIAILVWIKPVLNAYAYSGSGAPILPAQFLAILGFMAALIAFARAIRVAEKAGRLWWLIGGVGLYALAVGLWSATRIPLNYFMLPANTPDNAIFPYSDASLYDLNAQLMLIGQGLAGGSTLPRPLYSFFVGLLHVLFGQDYRALIGAQTAVLALIPVGLHLLGKRLQHSWAGVLAGLLLIFREYNQTLLAEDYTLGSPRMLLSEGLAALLLIGFTLLAIRWLKNVTERPTAILCGLTLGLLLLLRTQTAVLAAALFLAILVSEWARRRELWKPFLFFVLGAALVVLPWMGRNFFRTGNFTLEDPTYFSQVITTSLLETAESGSSGGAAFAGRGEQVLAHSVNSVMSGLYQLPFGFHDGTDLRAYAARYLREEFFPYLWLDAGQILIVALHLLILLIGIALAWSTARWAGVLPVLFYLTYDLTAAIFGYSGWRFIQPVDWILLLYWAIGAAWLLGRLLTWLLRFPAPAPVASPMPVSRLRIPQALFLAILAGVMLPAGELFFRPQLVIRDRQAATADALAAASVGIETEKFDALAALAEDPGTTILEGYSYYPFLLADDWSLARSKLPAVALQARPIMYFLVRGEESARVFFPATDSPPALPHADRVIVIGCPRGELIEAVAIIFYDPDPQVVLSRTQLPAACEK